MGGVAFVVATLISLVLFYICCVFSDYSISLDIMAIAAAVIAFTCALLGAIDDLAKLRNRANQGLSARVRMLTEMSLGTLLAIVILKINPQATHLITFHSAITVPPLIFICLSIFLVAATTNAVNLHDGMDGLATGTGLLILVSLALMFWHLENYGLVLLATSCAGALSGFLLFNRYPAKIFMGDTGSLFLGGLLAASVLTSGLLFWFIPLALIYILETLSVIVQVSYFKLTKTSDEPWWYKLTHKLPGEGKRLFRMAPLHHHFEAVLAEKDISEWQVVLGFWLVQLLLCVLVLAVFFTF